MPFDLFLDEVDLLDSTANGFLTQHARGHPHGEENACQTARSHTPQVNTSLRVSVTEVKIFPENALHRVDVRIDYKPVSAESLRPQSQVPIRECLLTILHVCPKGTTQFPPSATRKLAKKRETASLREELTLPISDHLLRARRKFSNSFWVANISELFERLAFYAPQAILAIYLHEYLRFSVLDTGRLMGYFGFAAFSLSVLSGALADRFGFRKSLLFAFLLLSVGYSLLGSLSTPWMAYFTKLMPLYYVALLFFLLTAIGPSLVKPCVLGITTKCTSETVRPFGYAIYYTLMSIGACLGPVMAYLVRENMGIENVFRVSSLTCALMFALIFFLFREPNLVQPLGTSVPAIRNLLSVFRNTRFLLLLAVYSAYWTVFWQFFVSMPIYVWTYINPQAKIDLILTIDPLLITFFQVGVSAATRKWVPKQAMVVGLAMSGVSMFILSLERSVWMVMLGLAAIAIGEMIQAPRYYEFIGKMAPAEQVGLYMGWAFLPVGIGYLAGGWIGGLLFHRYCELAGFPRRMWLVWSAVGFATAIGMSIYARIEKSLLQGGA